MAANMLQCVISGVRKSLQNSLSGIIVGNIVLYILYFTVTFGALQARELNDIKTCVDV
jgi:hypothetical protein